LHNIHAGQSWQIFGKSDEYVPAIKSTVAPSQPMGIDCGFPAKLPRARQPER